jgi:hypothetical protein
VGAILYITEEVIYNIASLYERGYLTTHCQYMPNSL